MAEALGGEDLAALRSSLDGIDRDLVSLIAARLDVVGRVAAAKAAGGSRIRDVGREREVLAKVELLARECGVSVTLVRSIFGELIRYAVAHQSAPLVAPTSTAPVRIAFQGVDHAYSHLAAQKYVDGLGRAGEYTGCRTFGEAVRLLVTDGVDLAVLPIENTTAGSITAVYDLLRTEDVSIVGEETWRVDHCLAALADVPLDSLRRVLSHPQGLEQCSIFLQTLPGCTPVTYFDTAEALRHVAEEADSTQAAIGSPEAAEAYGLVVLRHNIANQERNFTRFVVLAREATRVDLRVPCKTSLIVVTRHEHGALLRCLEVINEHDLSMTKLESRPRPGRPWEYLFFLDFEGNVGDPRVAAALDELGSRALSVKVLGSYPAKTSTGDPTTW